MSQQMAMKVYRRSKLQTTRWKLTFLRDADGTAAHADSQSVDSSIDQVFGLSCRYHCRGGGGGGDDRVSRAFVPESVTRKAKARLTISSHHLQLWILLLDVIDDVDLKQ